MRRYGIILAVLMLASFKSFADSINSSYFYLTLPQEWDVQHEERQGQLGAKIGTATKNGYPSPWVMMEYCIKPVEAQESVVPACKAECPANPFDSLVKSDIRFDPSKVKKIITPNQTKFLADHSHENGSILLMTSCSHKGIASIFIFSENSIDISQKEFGPIIDSFKWK